MLNILAHYSAHFCLPLHFSEAHTSEIVHRQVLPKMFQITTLLVQILDVEEIFPLNFSPRYGSFLFISFILLIFYCHILIIHANESHYGVFIHIHNVF